MSGISVKDFAAYQVDPARGFLPSQDPLERLPAGFEAWDRLASQMPALLLAGKLRPALERLTSPDLNLLESDGHLQRAMLLLSLFGNAYVWGDEKPATVVPRGIALPWWTVAERLGQPPIITYSSLVLYNWRLLDKSAPPGLGNLATLQLFLGGSDEQWFYLISVAIEAKGASAIRAIVDAQNAAARGRVADLADSLKEIAYAIAEMRETLLRVEEKCDPYIYYHRVRPFIAGWGEAGVVYEGVSGEPQKFVGASAAQSSLLQAMDAGLGVIHRDDETSPFLFAMRRYMPPAHRRFIEALEDGPSLRQFVLDRKQSVPALCDLYDACIQALDHFRKKHLELAVRYISRQAPGAEATEGTGGTNFVSFLSKVRKETKEKEIGARAGQSSLARSDDGRPKALRYLALGDSYTIGESVSANERWPAQLTDLLREWGFPMAEPMIIAQTGWTTDELWAGIERENPTNTFELVSLLIGVNNQYRGRNIEDYRAEFRTLLKRAVEFAAGNAKRVIVLSIPDWGETPFAEGRDRGRIAEEINQFNAVSRDETDGAGAYYIDVTSESRKLTRDYKLIAADGLHPSGKMYEAWACLVLPSALNALIASADAKILRSKNENY